MTEEISSKLPQVLKPLAENVLSIAKQQGASSADVALSQSQGFSVTVRQGELETIEYNQDKAMGVTVYLGTQKGNASSSDLSAAAIQQTVAAAIRIAKQGSEDPCHGLADAKRMAYHYPILDLYHPWNIDVAKAKDLAFECEAYALQHDDRIKNSEGASIASYQSYSVYANSHGFLGERQSSRHSVNCMVIAEQAGEMQRDYHYSVARNASHLEALRTIGVTAAKRSVARLGARQLKTQTVPVIFSADLARGLIGHFIAAISGGQLYRKSSFLLHHLGKKVFPNTINMIEQPHLPQALASYAFDAEGVATQRRHLVTDGVLQSYVLSSYSARRLGLESTANAGGIHNLILESGPHDLTALLKQMDTGLLVTELLGQGVNITTGDYSRGACGFWVAGGEIQYPVNEITIAGQLQTMFQGIVAIANDVDKRGSIQTGSILIEAMKVAGC